MEYLKSYLNKWRVQQNECADSAHKPDGLVRLRPRQWRAMIVGARAVGCEMQAGSTSSINLLAICIYEMKG